MGLQTQPRVMAPVPAGRFRELLAARSRSAVAAFVADLWTARGRPATSDGAHVHVDGGPTMVVPDRPGGTTGCAVVVPADGEGDGLDPADLRGALLYDAPRERAAALFERHFDRPLDGDWPGATASGGRGGDPEGASPGPRNDGVSASTGRDAGPPASAGRDSDRPAASEPGGDGPPATERGDDSPDDVDGAEGFASRRVAAASVLVLVALAAVVAAGGGPAALSPAPPSTTPTAVPQSETPETAFAFGQGPNDAAYPPGLGDDGVTDAGLLGDGHAGAVAGDSYTVVITYREYYEGTPNGLSRETVRVANRTAYRSTVTTTGGFVQDPVVVADEEVYADGSTRYVRREGPDGVTYAATPAVLDSDGEGVVADRIETLVARRLSANRTRVVGGYDRGGRTRFVVTFAGQRRVGSAIVGDDGFVQLLRWRVTPADHPRVTAEVTIRVRRGPVTLQAPEWYAAARNGSDVGDPWGRNAHS